MQLTESIRLFIFELPPFWHANERNPHLPDFSDGAQLFDT